MRRTPSSLVCALSSRDKSRGGQGQGQHTHSSALSKYREERKKPFRLRGRLRLAVRRLRRLSPSLVLHALVTYARAHSKQVALSILFGCTVAMGCLCLKLQSVPTAQFVPYSELVRSIHSGSVTSVLFEEGSRKVFFNVKSTDDEDVRNPLQTELSASKADLASPTSPTDDEDVRNPLQTELSASKADLASPTLPEILTANDGTKQEFSARTVSSPSAAAAAFSSTLKGIGGAPKPPLKTHSHPWKFATWRIEYDEAYLMSLMRTMEVTYSSTPQPMSMALRSTLIAIISMWIPLIPLFWLMHRQFSGGGSSSKKWQVNSESVKFEDVAGVDEVKVELMEIVSYHRGATNFRRLGAKLPKGVLLVGPPGTGKTLLARAVATETGVPFFAASASEFVEMFVGRGAARIRELFNGARKCSPSIIFIDELDAVGGRRGRSFNDERDQTLNQLLTEMDGFESKTGVLVIAATNRPEALDPALCRPGRFSRKVFIKEPDFKGREQILAVHMRGIPIEGDVQVVQSTLASITGGFVGADLANLVNEAALLAGREGRSVVTLEDFKTAVMRAKFGVGNRPAFSGALARVTDWLQPKTPAGYEAPSCG